LPHDTALIATIAAAFVLAFGFGLLASLVRLPPLVGYLLAGVTMGPFTPGFVGDLSLSAQLAEIGVILLMFGVGLHFSIPDLVSVWRIAVPKLKPNEAFRAYKISKRFDQDISAVMAGFRFTLDGRRVSSARIAFGGMAATPKRGALTEAALQGASLDQPASWSAAIEALAKDFQPISDMRASAAYRVDVAQGLLRKALMEVAGATNTRVLGARQAVA